MTIWRMHYARWITKATDTHSEYVILTAFQQLQWLRERAPMASLVTPFPKTSSDQGYKRALHSV
jgi:hypothetical protein